MRLDHAVAAAKAGHRTLVRELVTGEPALLDDRDDEGEALLDHAIWALLVPDFRRPPTLAPDGDGARMGIVRDLLDAGADPNGRTPPGWTPLHSAQYENHVPLTEELLARGADPHAEVYGSGGTPLVQALFWGHVEAAEALAAHDVTPRNLRVAAGLGREDRMAELFAPDGTLTEPAGRWRDWYRPHDDLPAWQPTSAPQEILDEAFCYAARNGRKAVLPILLEHGAEVRGDPYGGSALHWAASQGRVAICRWLLERGADVDQRAVFGAQRGVTPLHAAAWMDRIDSADLLLEHGADPTIKDATHDGTPLGWAEYMEAPRVAALLRGT